ncbi:tRNA (guanine(10)-N(2))-methyltransferase TRMT11 [Dermatophagoides pteronyssinus]|uniref:tRNA (guanine(10)-N(2))-methyltransferase TRMT11 n=1 Tax=Dermatophagoides pteronyssinus TaxID=6956 RepID=UPI003F6788F1
MSQTKKSYVIRFANELNNFRSMEFNALASLYKLDFKFIEPISEKPFMIIETNDEAALLNVFNRIILATSLFECWVSSLDFDEFIDEVNNCKQIHNDYYRNCSFRIQVEAFGRKISQQQKIERIERLSGLPLKGKIRMINPDVTFYYMEYYGLNPNRQPEKPYQILFGKWITDSNRKLCSIFSLKTRKFIANTSMDATLSFLMANIAQININDIVYDPFVGSGSILVSAAYFGAYVCGTDIDYPLLHGMIKPTRVGSQQRGDDESVHGNLKQYKLESRYIDVIAGDSSLPLFRNDIQFDAIITDPPYGIRESRERIGTKKSDPTVPIEYLDRHLPAKLQYKLDDIYNDLLNFSAQHLKPNGIVIFWAPYFKHFYKNFKQQSQTLPQIDSLPKYDHQDPAIRFQHENLRLLSFGEQKLTKNCSRILVVMQKILK